MMSLRNIRIERKITLVILTTCAVVLSINVIALGLVEWFGSRRSIAHGMDAMAGVIARNSQAALAFGDADAATRTLRSLESEVEVASAQIYDSEGSPFASWADSAAPVPPRAGSDGVQFAADRLLVVRPITLDGQRIGTIRLEARMDGVYARLGVFAGFGLVTLLGSMVLAVLISSRMQRLVSDPILALTHTSARIARQRDFSVRAERAGDDEVGELTDVFNEVLDVIEERERNLESANASLTREIAERERSESRVQMQLERLELLNRITRAIAERHDLASIFQVVVRSLEENLPLDFAAICPFSEDEGAFVVSALAFHDLELREHAGLTPESRIAIESNGLAGCLQGQVIHEPLLTAVDLPLSKTMVSAGLQSLVVAPLTGGDHVAGVLLAARREAYGFSSPECEFLRQVSEQVALAANQTELHTALRRAYDDLQLTQQAMLQQERLRALGEMASGIAHDINNAMFPITLYTGYLLEKEPGLSQRGRSFLEIMATAAGDVAQTVSRMGEFYRKREQQHELVPVAVSGVVRKAVELTQARWFDIAQQRGAVIHVQTELDPTDPTVMALESELREALINLIFNAADAMPEGGTLTLRSSTLSSEESGASVVLEVIDTGHGMDDATRQRCLEPFFTTKGQRGTGLGLAMVYGIAQRHDAILEIDSAPGRGTTVRLTFPQRTSHAASGTETELLRAPENLRLLIVDDDPLLIRTLTDILEGDSHEVTAVGGGRQAVDVFCGAIELGRPFSGVITDLGMPSVDGRHVAAAIKTASPSTPVIMLTGWGQRASIQGNLPPNVDCLVSKPPSLHHIRAALARCFSSK